MSKERAIIEALPERFQSLSGVKTFIVEATEYLYVSPDMEWVQENIPYEEREEYDHNVWETLQESSIVYDYAKKTPSLIEITDNDNFGGDNLFYEAHYKFKVLAKDEQQAKEKVQESLYGGYDTQSSAFHTQTKLFKKEFENLLGIPVVIEEGEVEFGDIYPYDEEEEKRLKVAFEKQTQEKKADQKKETKKSKLIQDHMYALQRTIVPVASEYFSQGTVIDLGNDVAVQDSELPADYKEDIARLYRVARVLQIRYGSYAPPTNRDYRKEDLYIVYGLGASRTFEGREFTDARITVYLRKSRKGSRLGEVGNFKVSTPEWFKEGDDTAKEIALKLNNLLYEKERKEAIEKQRKSLKVYPLVKKGKSIRLSNEGKLAPYVTQYYIGDKPEDDAQLIREVTSDWSGKITTLQYTVSPTYGGVFPEKSFKPEEKDQALLYLYEQLDILHKEQQKKDSVGNKKTKEEIMKIIEEIVSTENKGLEKKMRSVVSLLETDIEELTKTDKKEVERTAIDIFSTNRLIDALSDIKNNIKTAGSNEDPIDVLKEMISYYQIGEGYSSISSTLASSLRIIDSSKGKKNRARFVRSEVSKELSDNLPEGIMRVVASRYVSSYLTKLLAKIEATGSKKKTNNKEEIMKKIERDLERMDSNILSNINKIIEALKEIRAGHSIGINTRAIRTEGTSIDAYKLYAQVLVGIKREIEQGKDPIEALETEREYYLAQIKLKHFITELEQVKKISSNKNKPRPLYGIPLVGRLGLRTLEIDSMAFVYESLTSLLQD